MSDILQKYRRGEEVKINELDLPLFFYILKERWKVVTLLVLLLLFAFFVGYYVGYNNAIVYMNELILNVTESNPVAGINWTI